MNSLTLTRYLDAASPFAHDIDYLVALIAVLVGFWFFVTQAVFFTFIIKFRAKEGLRAKYITGDLKGEKTWLNIPHVLILICDVVIIFFAIRVWYDVKQNMPPPDETVRITAQQWAWTFRHSGLDGKLDTPDDVVTVDELRVKAGQTYHYELTSRDVLHSFSVPVFRLKQDAVPGRTIKGWFKATLTGDFDIQCAEICGIGHALMPARLVVETPDRHREWLQSQTPMLAGAPPAAGTPSPALPAGGSQ